VRAACLRALWRCARDLRWLESTVHARHNAVVFSGAAAVQTTLAIEKMWEVLSGPQWSFRA
jgi:hypothetical protein